LKNLEMQEHTDRQRGNKLSHPAGSDKTKEQLRRQNRAGSEESKHNQGETVSGRALITHQSENAQSMTRLKIDQSIGCYGEAIVYVATEFREQVL